MMGFLPLVCILWFWWDSGRYESVAYWDGSHISPAIGQGYGCVRIEWIKYTTPSTQGEASAWRHKIDDSNSPGFRALGFHFPPAIDHRYDVTPQDRHNLTFLAWWLLGLVYLALWITSIIGLRLRLSRIQPSLNTTNGEQVGAQNP